MKANVDLTEDRAFRKQRDSSRKIFVSSIAPSEDIKSNSCVLTGSANNRRNARLAIEACSEDFCDRCGEFIKPWDKKSYALCFSCDEQLKKEKELKIVTI